MIHALAWVIFSIPVAVMVFIGFMIVIEMWEVILLLFFAIGMGAIFFWAVSEIFLK